jgi:hypothetical protein
VVVTRPPTEADYSSFLGGSLASFIISVTAAMTGAKSALVLLANSRKVCDSRISSSREFGSVDRSAASRCGCAKGRKIYARKASGMTDVAASKALTSTECRERAADCRHRATHTNVPLLRHRTILAYSPYENGRAQSYPNTARGGTRLLKERSL